MKSLHLLKHSLLLISVVLLNSCLKNELKGLEAVNSPFDSTSAVVLLTADTVRIDTGTSLAPLRDVRIHFKFNDSLGITTNKLNYFFIYVDGTKKYYLNRTMGFDDYPYEHTTHKYEVSISYDNHTQSRKFLLANLNVP